MDWQAVTWKKAMQYVSVVAGIAGALGFAAAAKDAYKVVEPVLPATHHFVDEKLEELVNAMSDSFTSSSRETQRMIANLSVDMLRTQVTVARDALAIKKSQRIQQSDLFSRNPNDMLVKLQLDQMDKDLIEDDTTLRAMVCELNKRTIAGFIC